MGKAHDRARSGRGKRRRFEQASSEGLPLSSSDDEAADDEEDHEAEVEAEREPRVDGSTVCCVVCGTTDSSLFSTRMLHVRGRYGERVRRCKACVSAAEEEERAAAAERRRLSVQSASSATFDAAEDPSKVAERKRRKLLKALRSVEEIKAMHAAGEPLERTQLEKLEREAALRAELEAFPPMESSGEATECARDEASAAPPREAAGQHPFTSSTPSQKSTAGSSVKKRRAAFIAREGASAEERGVTLATLSSLTADGPALLPAESHDDPTECVSTTSKPASELVASSMPLKKMKKKKKKRVQPAVGVVAEPESEQVEAGGGADEFLGFKFM